MDKIGFNPVDFKVHWASDTHILLLIPFPTEVDIDTGSVLFEWQSIDHVYPKGKIYQR